MAKTKRQLLIEFLQDNVISVQEAIIILNGLNPKEPIKAKGEDREKAILPKYDTRHGGR